MPTDVEGEALGRSARSYVLLLNTARSDCRDIMRLELRNRAMTAITRAFCRRHEVADYCGLVLAMAGFALPLSLPIWGHALAQVLH